MDDSHNRAAVGLLVRGDSILLIKRIEREGDPWSGQIALPGGFVKAGESGEQAALREVYEETDIMLDESSIIGSMPVQKPTNRRRVTVFPYVMSVNDYSMAKPGPEVADIRVVRLSDLDHRMAYFNGRDAFLAGDWIVWGLTHNILSSYLNNEMTGR